MTSEDDIVQSTQDPYARFGGPLSQDPYEQFQSIDTSFYAKPSNWPQPRIPDPQQDKNTNWAEEEASHWAHEQASSSRRLNQILSPEDLEALEQKYETHLLEDSSDDSVCSYNARDGRDR